MRRRFGFWAILLAVLLTTGILVGRWVWSPQTPPTMSFRAWWWEYRELDVAVQVGLMFAGALGIAALMPPEEGQKER